MRYKKGVSAIVPAYNEAATIVQVVRRLLRHPDIDEVIVVSDGSTDDTAARVSKTDARLIVLRENGGKGNAMEIGVRAAAYDTLLFADADLQGLTDAMIAQLVDKVRDERYEMFTLIRDRASEHFQLYLPSQYVVGGERSLTRRLWNMVPAEDRQGFGVELALNYYAAAQGMHIGHELAPGLSQISKERKRGLVRGLWLRLWMVVDCAKALWKLHFLHRAKLVEV